MQPEGDASKADRVLRSKARGVDLFAVEERAVARAEVADVNAVFVARHLGVTPRDRRVEDGDVARQRASDHEEDAGSELERLEAVGGRQFIAHRPENIVSGIT